MLKENKKNKNKIKMSEEIKASLEAIKDQLESLEETINNKFDELILAIKEKQ